MNTERIIQLITDAVTDAVRERLPDLIAGHAKTVYEPMCEGLKNAEAALARLAANAVPPDAFEAVRDDVRRLLCEASTAHAALMADVPVRVAAEVRTAIGALTLPPGPAGAAGEPGRDGRDATFTPPVHWKTGITFARGSVVQHRGGLWFANVHSAIEPGEPLSGYSLMFDGCEPHRCEADPGGALTIVFRYASGIEKIVPLGFRPMGYAGVYDVTRGYAPQDLVTCEGSMWIARAASIGVRPGTDQGALTWTLVVKRGKDGRDGAPGPRGETGAQGPAGVAPAPKRKAVNGAAP